jgi:hypothetical protein
MPGFRFRLKDLPEQTGERRISIHWFFLPLGLVLVAVGLIGLRDYFLKNGPMFSMYWGSLCAFFGAGELMGFAICEKLVRAGRPPKIFVSIRARQIILFGGIVGYAVVLFIIFRLLPNQMACATPFFWVVGGGLVGNGIVCYFRKHPPKT